MNKALTAKHRGWKTHLAIASCEECKEVMVSTGGGKFVYCGCGKSFIDQERFSAMYVRLGGEAKFMEQVCPKGCKQKEHKENGKQA